MYGPPYPTAPPPAAPSSARPTMLMVGTGALFVTIMACLAETAFEVMLAKSFTTYATNASDQEVGDAMQPYLVSVIVLNAFIAIALGAAAALMMRRSNAGRIIAWSAGGICILVRLCCLSGLGLFGAVKSAVANDTGTTDASLDQMAPTWQIAGGAVASGVALIAVTVAIIVICTSPVGRWFRRTPATQPHTGYPYPPYQGY